MTRVDQFESTFKAAAKTLFEYEPRVLGSVLVLTDLEGEQAEAFGARVRGFLATLDAQDVRWETVPGSRFDSVAGLLAVVEQVRPDLVCTSRSLHREAWRWSYTLGRYVDVLAQETPVPLLVLPNPHAEAQAPEVFPHGPPTWGPGSLKTVMAVTDHLTGDHGLVNAAVRLTPADGTLVLAHVEDDAVFERYMDAVSKIPAIDTDVARETIAKQLLKEPHDYIGSCATVLREAGLDMTVEEVVTTGHHVATYRRLLERHAVDVLVIHTKEEDQMAMHGLAYPLVIELRHVPVLMI